MTQEQRTLVQIFAALTMLVDHIGLIFFPDRIWLRAVGRLSFPLFAFGIAEGVAHTRSFPRYLGRILLAALVSQPVYQLAFGRTDGNPLFMLAWGALAVLCWRQETAAGGLPQGYCFLRHSGAGFPTAGMAYGQYSCSLFTTSGALSVFTGRRR